MNLDHLTPVQRAICEAYLQLSVKQQDWVRLVRLRAALPQLTPTDVDAALMVMISTGEVHLAPDSNRKALTPEDHRDAIHIGNEALHILAISPEFYGESLIDHGSQTTGESSDDVTMTDAQITRLQAIQTEVTAGGGTLDAQLLDDGSIELTEFYPGHPDTHSLVFPDGSLYM